VQPGAVILGKFRVERVIGVGGMGAVVGARHLQLDERVAIKFLLPQVVAMDDVVQRFLREAKAAIRIRSEHCVRVLDVGTLESGAPYMVMEYLEGQDLAAMVAQHRPLPIPSVIDWVLQACEALAEAHAMGVVHRDLKPANLFLTHRADGTPSVKVLDFGISKQAASGADAGVTKTQAVLGSPRYMSPEQMRSTRDVDARTDVWALGAVVYELVTGLPPFDAETMTALCAAILQDAPRPPSALRPEVPPQLDLVLLAALEKDRDRRYANVAQLAAALAPFGSPVAWASAERCARVLGVVGTGTDPRALVVHRSQPPPHAPLAGATGGSSVPASTGSGASKSSAGPAVALIAFVAIAVVGGIVALVAIRRSHTAASVLPAASAVTTAPAASSAALAPLPSDVPSVSAGASLDAAPTAPSTRAPGGRVPPSRPGGPPGIPSSAPSAATPKPPASNANPFGDDRHG
jgi:eukaryotic-like serine/threonine-protein kinase